MFKSIRWKFITIYFLLVFIAMVIVGVFIIQQFEEYNLYAVSEKLTKLARDGLMKSFDNFENLDANREEIQKNINTWGQGFQEEIFVVNLDFEIIASSNTNFIDKSAVDVLDFQLLTDGFNGQIAEADSAIKSRGIVAKNMVFPILDKKTQSPKGILYLRADLSDIYKTLDKSVVILTKATVLALVITVILGYFIARSVTEPITDVTVKAAKMARGDFNQTVEIKSNDEIGQLAAMFNYLREKLNITLTEVFNEKSKLQTILDYMADGLIAVNNEGKIIHANPTALKMLGLTAEELENSLYDSMIKNLNHKLTLEYIEKNTEDWVGHENIKVEDSILHANYAPFRDEKGEKSGIVMVLQDITERQKLDNMRKEFVANVSHELKTPLTSIKSYTETLLDGALEDRDLSEHFLTVVNSEADRMGRLVRDLLQLSSFDYKQAKWNKARHDLMKVIKNSVLKMEMTAQNKKQRINLLANEEELMALFDVDRIEQVILNILSNAIKYTPDGGEVRVIAHREGSNAKLHIIDNGIGIPKEDLPRLFERFYRVDKARSREMGGTGLGLSIAKQIVEAHGGSIEIFSNEGEGAEVVITLPLDQQTV